MAFRSALLFVLAASCARAPAWQPTGGTPPAEPAAELALTAAAGPDDVVSPVATGDGSHAGLAQTAPGYAAEPAAAASPDPPLEGVDFIAQARVLFRIAACGAQGDVPARFDAAVVARHCDELVRAYGDYERTWVDVAKPFIASLRPADLPRVVVYPFGGGDLASALATFPDGTEFTTISLEPAGDVRPMDTLPADRIGRELASHRAHLERLFEKAHSRTENLEKESKTDLPGEILFALAALVVYGDEPLSLRYFRLGHDGSIEYVTQATIEKARGVAERHALFDNAELRFRRAGVPGSPVQVLRHISFNLDDFHLKAEPSLLAHLNAKGKVAAMTKAATHLLWNDHFSIMRTWLLDHTDWMISDSTGIPPRFAAAAGFVQDTYGTFNGPAPFSLMLDVRDSADVKRLFASQPARDLAFRYGYPDKDGNAHLIVTRRSSQGSDGGISR
jgi:hypothetical protein